MKRVLVLQFVWDDPPGYLGEIMEEHQIVCHTIKVEEEPVPDPTQYDALIAMGGPQHVGHNDTYPYLVGVTEAIRRAVEKEVPYLGLCLGGQLLASAMGAQVKKHTSASIGFYEVQFTEAGKKDPLFKGLPGYQQVIHWHEDTFDIPDGAVQLATNPQTQNQAFRYGRNAYGTQFHIEVTPAVLDVWLYHPEYRQEIVRTSGEDTVDTFISDRAQLYPLYREQSRRMFENFLRIAGLIITSSFD
jgi:GMP synthase-like glutamine amidotransferase